MSIKKIKDFPDGGDDLSGDDIFLFMDDPTGNGVTKKISLTDLGNAIGAGNPFDQNLNTSDFPSFSGVSLSNGTTLTTGTYDNNTGGNNGISLNCYVGYELNWQGGHLKSTYNSGEDLANIWCDSPIEFPGAGVDNVEINNTGITFADGTSQTSAGIVSNAADITGASTINNIVKISQSNYDAIVSKDPNTLYLITG